MDTDQNPTPSHLVYTAPDGVPVTLPTPDAMARFAADGFAGRLTDPNATTPATPAAPVAQTATDAGAVAAQQRNAAQMAVLDGMGFAPFGQIVEGADVVKKLYSGYGEGAPRGRGPDQGRIQSEGAAYLSKEFPKLDLVKTATLVP